MGSSPVGYLLAVGPWGSHLFCLGADLSRSTISNHAALRISGGL
jgi:hypothetical protein